MAFQTRVALSLLAVQVADETAPGANTAARVGTILQNIIDSTINYRAYAANLTQFSTIAPTEDVVFSSLPQGSVVLARTGPGIYTATLTGAFLLNKVPFISAVIAESTTATSIRSYNLIRTSNNVVTLTTTIDGVAADGVLQGNFIEIRVYP